MSKHIQQLEKFMFTFFEIYDALFLPLVVDLYIILCHDLNIIFRVRQYRFRNSHHVIDKVEILLDDLREKFCVVHIQKQLCSSKRLL